MQTDHFQEWFYNPFLVKFFMIHGDFWIDAYLETSAFKKPFPILRTGRAFFAFQDSWKIAR